MDFLSSQVGMFIYCGVSIWVLLFREFLRLPLSLQHISIHYAVRGPAVYIKKKRLKENVINGHTFSQSPCLAVKRVPRLDKGSGGLLQDVAEQWTRLMGPINFWLTPCAIIFGEIPGFSASNYYFDFIVSFSSGLDRNLCVNK